jgi:hypothetical protein
MLVVMVLTAVMALLGAGLLVSSSKYLANANAAKTGVGLSSCAQAVRQFLGSRADAGISAVSLYLSSVDAGTAKAIALTGGHYENAGTWRLPSTSNFGARVTIATDNLTNALPMSIGTSAPTTTGTAVCTDSDGRTYEVEFSLVGG